MLLTVTFLLRKTTAGSLLSSRVLLFTIWRHHEGTVPLPENTDTGKSGGGEFWKLQDTTRLVTSTAADSGAGLLGPLACTTPWV